MHYQTAREGKANGQNTPQDTKQNGGVKSYGMRNVIINGKVVTPRGIVKVGTHSDMMRERATGVVRRRDEFWSGAKLTHQGWGLPRHLARVIISNLQHSHHISRQHTSQSLRPR